MNTEVAEKTVEVQAQESGLLGNNLKELEGMRDDSPVEKKENTEDSNTSDDRQDADVKTEAQESDGDLSNKISQLEEKLSKTQDSTQERISELTKYNKSLEEKLKNYEVKQEERSTSPVDKFKSELRNIRTDEAKLRLKLVKLHEEAEGSISDEETNKIESQINKVLDSLDDVDDAKAELRKKIDKTKSDAEGQKLTSKQKEKESEFIIKLAEFGRKYDFFNDKENKFDQNNEILKEMFRLGTLDGVSPKHWIHANSINPRYDHEFGVDLLVQDALNNLSQKAETVKTKQLKKENSKLRRNEQLLSGENVPVRHKTEIEEKDENYLKTKDKAMTDPMGRGGIDFLKAHTKKLNRGG